MPIALSAREVETDAPIREYRVTEFLEIAERRRPQLLRMARRMTQCQEDAEDIVQEAFMKAFRALAHFRGEAQMSSWLGAIVQNTAHEHLRSRRSRMFVSVEYLCKDDNEFVEMDLPDPARNPEELWQDKEMETVVRAEVGKLSFVCRRAIELCVLEDRPQLAAASAMNLNVATMKSRVYRGKRLLARSVARRLGWRQGPLTIAADESVSRQA